jgi:hypothetical protein
MNQNRLTLEECHALYFDDTALLTTPEPLFRITGKSSGRYYYKFDAAGEPLFFISVTTMIRQTLPTSPVLIKWIADKGHDESEQYKFERSVFGTMMHMCFQHLLIHREFDFDQFLPGFMKGFMNAEGVSLAFFDEWHDDLQRHILGFAQFIIDHNVRPILIEGMLSHPDGYAGAIDLVCQMDIEEKGFFGETLKSGPNKGQPKETKMIRTINAIVDFKSGMKGFFPEHEVQLKAYENLVKYNFPHLADKHFRLFNYGPSDWRGVTPGYKLKDQTDSIDIEKFDHLVALAKIEMKKNSRKVLNITGTVKLDERNIQKNIEEITFETLAKRLEHERQNQTTGNANDIEFQNDIANIGEDQDRDEK